jgi:hypothetical protein
MQSVPITTDVISSNLDQGEVYNIMTDCIGSYIANYHTITATTVLPRPPFIMYVVNILIVIINPSFLLWY